MDSADAWNIAVSLLGGVGIVALSHVLSPYTSIYAYKSRSQAKKQVKELANKVREPLRTLDDLSTYPELAYEGEQRSMKQVIRQKISERAGFQEDIPLYTHDLHDEEPIDYVVCFSNTDVRSSTTSPVIAANAIVSILKNQQKKCDVYAVGSDLLHVETLPNKTFFPTPQSGFNLGNAVNHIYKREIEKPTYALYLSNAEVSDEKALQQSFPRLLNQYHVVNIFIELGRSHRSIQQFSRSVGGVYHATNNLNSIIRAFEEATLKMRGVVN